MTASLKVLAAIMLSVALQSPASGQKTAEPFLLKFTHGVLRAAEIGQLDEIALPEGEREIRIWVGFGVIQPDHMLRLRVNQSGNVQGLVLAYFESDPSHMDPKVAKEFQRGALRACEDHRVGDEFTVCTLPYRSQDWQSFYENLVELGLLTLPDESKLPREQWEVTDGSSMVVEILHGSQYRAYQYSNSWIRNEPEAVAATEIQKVVGAAIAAARAAPN